MVGSATKTASEAKSRAAHWQLEGVRAQSLLSLRALYYVTGGSHSSLLKAAQNTGEALGVDHCTHAQSGIKGAITSIQVLTLGLLLDYVHLQHSKPEHPRNINTKMGSSNNSNGGTFFRLAGSLQGTDRSRDCLNIFLEYVPGGSIASLLSKFGAQPLNPKP